MKVYKQRRGTKKKQWEGEKGRFKVENKLEKKNNKNEAAESSGILSNKWIT